MNITPGLIVEYTLAPGDVEQINRRREDARKRRSGSDVGNTGFVLHTGNLVRSGETYPLVITRVWPDTTMVNGQLLLDGNQTPCG